MARDPFVPEDDKFKRGDLVRVADPDHPEIVKFARAFRVHQAWVEIVPGEDGPFKRDCEVVSRPSENGEDYGFVALPESQLVALAHLASVAGELSADALWAEVERVKAQPWRADT